jgi:dihydrofolate synthase/folylpolyglutamate synthase
VLPDINEVINYIEDVTMVGRFQTIRVEGVPVIFDVAHNPASSQRLADKLSKKTGSGNVIAVWASLQDKDLANIVQPMCHSVSHWFIGDLGNIARAATTSLLEQTLNRLGVSNVTTSKTLADAFTAALKLARAEDQIVVFGTFYTVSGILGNLFKPKAFQHYGMVCGSG